MGESNTELGGRKIAKTMFRVRAGVRKADAVQTFCTLSGVGLVPVGKGRGKESVTLPEAHIQDHLELGNWSSGGVTVDV